MKAVLYTSTLTLLKAILTRELTDFVMEVTVEDCKDVKNTLTISDKCTRWTCPAKATVLQSPGPNLVTIHDDEVMHLRISGPASKK